MRRRVACAAAPLVVAIVSAAACTRRPSPEAPSAEATPGAARLAPASAPCTVERGGQVRLSNGAALAVPAGALRADAEVSAEGVAEVSSPPAGARRIGPCYRMSVGGAEHYTFRRPVAVTLPFDPAWLVRATHPKIAVAVRGEAGWTFVPGVKVDAEARTVGFALAHFSEIVTSDESGLIDDVPAEPGGDAAVTLDEPQEGKSYAGWVSPALTVKGEPPGGRPIRFIIKYGDRGTHFLRGGPTVISLLGIESASLPLGDVYAPVVAGSQTWEFSAYAEANAGKALLTQRVSFSVSAPSVADDLNAADARLELAQKAVAFYLGDGPRPGNATALGEKLSVPFAERIARSRKSLEGVRDSAGEQDRALKAEAERALNEVGRLAEAKDLEKMRDEGDRKGAYPHGEVRYAVEKAEEAAYVARGARLRLELTRQSVAAAKAELCQRALDYDQARKLYKEAHAIALEARKRFRSLPSDAVGGGTLRAKPGEPEIVGIEVSETMFWFFVFEVEKQEWAPLAPRAAPAHRLLGRLLDDAIRFSKMEDAEKLVQQIAESKETTPQGLAEYYRTLAGAYRLLKDDEARAAAAEKKAEELERK